MDKVRYGIVGCGSMGGFYIKNRLENVFSDDSVLTAACDINPDRLKQFEGTDVAVFEKYEDLLDSGLVDAIVIATPHYLHPPIAKAALERNIHAFSEKPAGVYTKQVKEVIEAANKSKAHYGIQFNQRTHHIYRKMKEMIANGDIGELQRVNWIITNWYRTQNYYNSGSWRATWEGEGGGVLINQSPHQIDLFWWIVGEMPIEVSARCSYGRWHDIEVEDDVTATFRYKNGATGVFITSTGEYPGTNRLEIVGTKGTLLWDAIDYNTLIFYKLARDSYEFSMDLESHGAAPALERIVVETDGLSTQHVGNFNNFCAGILGKEPFFVDGKTGIHGVELMNGMELSGWNDGETVSFPIDEERYLRELNEHIKNGKEKAVKSEKGFNVEGTFGTK
ncbi:MAG: Gfo/Idh/MocA family oxidoreductase [Clostridia bacterium]|nr:Gfo/Idh/MocA family oxidoreductase [Clostridia bacterium]